MAAFVTSEVEVLDEGQMEEDRVADLFSLGR